MDHFHFFGNLTHSMNNTPRVLVILATKRLIHASSKKALLIYSFRMLLEQIVRLEAAQNP